ncbi:MAG: DnaA regulatory inactivator Hda [Halioglobus sp.]
MAELGPQTLGQLALPVDLNDGATFENFLPFGGNAQVIAALHAQLNQFTHEVDAAKGVSEQFIYLHGAAGCGKTHLLQAVANADSAGSLYLPLADLQEFDPVAVLQQAERSRRICIDDLHAVAGDTAWEGALFDFYNRAREARCCLLIAADVAPRALSLGLEDLRSRLSWGVVFQLEEPDDQAKADILALRGAARSMTLSPAVASYIVSRSPRQTGHLLAVLDLLSEASLVKKRAISVPFVKEVMGW